MQEQMKNLWKRILCRKNEHKNSGGAALSGSASACFCSLVYSEPVL